mgnify:CR=1 FL=1
MLPVVDLHGLCVDIRLERVECVGQFRKSDGGGRLRRRNRGGVKWKHVMHLLRLLSAGVTTL